MVSHSLMLGFLAFQGAGSAQETARAVTPAVPNAVQVREISPQERGDIYMARKMYREAIDIYKTITPPSALIANKIGIAYHQLSDMDAAERYYQRAAKLDKTFAEPLNNLGTIYYKRESYRRAVNQYKKALRLKPNSAATLANLGTAYFARKQNKLASDCYREALRIDPRVFEGSSSGGAGSIMREKSIGDRAGFFYIMAKSYAQEGLVEQALNYIRKAIEEGFKDRNKFTEESEFSKLQENPEFKVIMALEPRSLKTAQFLKSLAAILSVAAFSLTGCSRGPVREERLAIVPFDNLTGDPDLEWVNAAAPAILSDQLVGIPNFSLVRSPEARDASLSGATKILHGSVTRQGSQFRLEGRIEDAQSHKFDPPLVSDGPILRALADLATKINPGARPYSTQNEEAGEAWGRRDYEKATKLDPDFGAGWAGWMASLNAQGKAPEALAVAKQALARPTLKTDLTKAQLALAYASQIKDMPGRRAALNQILKIIPEDVAALATLAEAEGYAHNFPAAAAVYRRIIAKEPNNAGALNGLAYAEAEGGDLAAALKAIETYQKLPNQAANALDSLGEIHFMNGKFKEARRFFDEVAVKDPNFLNGSPVYKSAYAQWLGGDLAGADAAMRKFLDTKKTQGDVALEWREASWLYVTGRKDEALKKLDSSPANQKGMMDRQRAVWQGAVKPPNDLEQLRKLYETTAPPLDGLARVIYARALLSAGKKDEASELLKRYPLPDSAGDPLLQSLVFPEYLQLRRELNLK